MSERKGGVMKKVVLLLFVCSCLVSFSSRKDTTNNNNSSAIAEYNAGVEAQGNKNYQEAIQHYLNAIEQNKKFPEVWNNLGYCYRMVAWSYLEKSDDAYDTAIKYKSPFEDALEYQGELYLTMGKIKKSYENYLKLKQMKSSKADTLKKKLDDTLEEAQDVLKQYSP